MEVMSMRLINADGLEEPFAKVMYKALNSTVGWSLGRMYEECRKVIDRAPTVEVETIRHGQWVATGDANGFALWDSCSVCGYGLSAINSGRNYNFCPNCGAKMKQGDE